MNLAVKLQVRPSQSLAMTPQLLQSIRLLQYGNRELQAFLERQAQENPLIRIDRTGMRASPAAAGAHGTTPNAAGRNGSAPLSRAPATSGWAATASRGGARPIENLAERRRSLRDHAMGEIADILCRPGDRQLAEALFSDLDEAGYLRVDAETAAAELGVPAARVAAVLAALRRQAEPAGLFARDLSECLSLQLARRGRLDPVMKTVLSRLDLLSRRDFSALKRLTGEDEAGLMEILTEIRGLDPKPGCRFAGFADEPLAPDVLVMQDEDGEWRVELNAEMLPRILVDNDYARSLSQRCSVEAERSFLTEAQTSAGWLQRSLDQRAKTILKVAAEIVRRQEAFLTEGVSGLRPMTLAQVAEAVGLHESTVSRVTANKAMATPGGLFEMKYFFTVAIASSDGGEALSAEDVKGRIRRMIAGERAESVLSDEDIALRLKEEGVDLARRTVAKYREAMGLGSSVQRRRELNARRLAS